MPISRPDPDVYIPGDQSRGKISLESAIGIPKVNAEISSVMEGGEIAFGLRKQKYGF